MNKEYDRNNTGSLWVADKQTIKGETYYNGTLTIDNKDYSVTMFKNNSDNPKAPAFRLKVNDKQTHKEDNVGVVVKEVDKAFIDFADSIEITDNDIDSNLAF